MPRPWFSLQPCGDEFLASARHREVGVFDIRQPAQSVWEALTGDDTLSWCRALSGVEWTSDRPFGEGTTRTVKTPGGLIVLNEVYFRWEEGRRKSFYINQASLPLFRRFAEDYVVEHTGPSTCRFTWTVASEPSAAGRPGTPINRMITRSLFADTRRHFGAG